MHARMMRGRRGLAAIAALAIIGVASVRVASASDHQDNPLVELNPAMDMSDFYAFPGSAADRVVLVLNSRPLLTPAQTPGAAWDAAAFAYVASAFTVAHRSGSALALRSCGIRRTGEVLWVCVETTSAAGLAPLTVRNAVLTDLFADQVNVVQATVAGARRSVLFTPADRAKTLT